MHAKAAIDSLPAIELPDLAFVKHKPLQLPSAEDTASCKREYIRAYACANHSCPRCGRRHGSSRDAPFTFSSLKQRHLCDFFTVPPKKHA